MIIPLSFAGSSAGVSAPTATADRQAEPRPPPRLHTDGAAGAAPAVRPHLYSADNSTALTTMQAAGTLVWQRGGKKVIKKSKMP